MLEGIVSWILDLLTDPVGFFSVVFSGALAALYWRQFTIQDEQRDLMEIEQEPTVLVDGFRGGTEERGGIESLEVKLSNLGRNPATELELKVASGFHEDTPFLGGVETEPLEEVDFDEEMEQGWRKDYGDYLEPQERASEFVVYDLPIHWSHEEDWYGGRLSLSHLRRELNDYMEPNTVRLKVWVQYKDHEDKTQEVEVFDSVLPLCDKDGERIWSVDWMLTNSSHPGDSHPLNPDS